METPYLMDRRPKEIGRENGYEELKIEYGGENWEWPMSNTERSMAVEDDDGSNIGPFKN